jgi:hypothetical protein
MNNPLLKFSIIKGKVAYIKEVLTRWDKFIKVVI